MNQMGLKSNNKDLIRDKMRDTQKRGGDKEITEAETRNDVTTSQGMPGVARVERGKA